MTVHYLSCHEVLEFDEVSLFTELGHDVFSNGAYLQPEGHHMLSRPGIPKLTYHEEWADIARRTPRTELPDSLIDPFDLFIIMHQPEILVQNWPKLRKKKVIWRSIGQSTPDVESMLKPLVGQGLKIVRYSPMEQHIPNYAGANAFIRFYKDPQELGNWTGHDVSVINFTQTLKGRRNFCHYDHLIEMMSGFPSKVYGSGNEDLGSLNGGKLPWELMKGRLRDSRAYAYGGTWPAPYTLSFIEAWMTGIPMVCIGKNLAEKISGLNQFQFYEVPSMGENGKHFFCADDVNTLRSHLFLLLNDYEFAKKMSTQGRQKAIELFGKATIKPQWEQFLKEL